ncbi:MAG: hypothetical protein U0798_17890 [Gemmataceae bacterium]
MSFAKTYSARLVCRLVGVPRSSMDYNAVALPDETMVRNALLDLAEEWPMFCNRRLTTMMRRLDWKVNAKRVRRLRGELNLTGEAPPRGVRTTDSRHSFPRYENHVKTLEIKATEHVWVTDITDVKLRREFVYLAVVLDVFTRLIRGWHLGRSLDRGQTLATVGTDPNTVRVPSPSCGAGRLAGSPFVGPHAIGTMFNCIDV